MTDRAEFRQDVFSGGQENGRAIYRNRGRESGGVESGRLG